MRHPWFIALACAAALARSAAAAPSSEESLVRRYVAAFNHHDVDATIACLDSSFRWYAVGGDSLRRIVSGRERQRESLARYYGAFPDAASEADGLIVNGPWVTVRERLRWTGKQGPAENVAIAVYEVREGVIRRVYYFPPVRSEAGGAK